MEIRPAEIADIPAIVDLLKMSLGESLTPKSEIYWRWKHLDNPFGTSPVLLATENGILIGVRAFLKWQWQLNGAVIHAVRAVDTATHPQYQGRGVFKKLTLQLVTQCREGGMSFVFNTPNQQSKPGYLKMGWIEAGKFPIRIRPGSVSALARNVLTREVQLMPPADESVSSCLSHAGFESLLRSIAASNKSQIVTFHTPSSLSWRYANVPVATYFANTITIGNDVKAAAFYRFKKSTMGLELRISDIFAESPKFAGQLQESLSSIARTRGASYVTASGIGDYTMFGSRFWFKARIGPEVTVRELNKGYMNDLTSFSKWNATIGDLELF